MRLIAIVSLVVLAASSVQAQSVAEWNNRGRQAFEKGDYPTAVEGFRGALSALPADAGAAARSTLESNLITAILAHVTGEISRGRLREARRGLREVRGLSPNEARIPLYEGVLAWRQRRRKQALSLLKESIRRNPRSGLAHEYLGLVHYERDDLPKAIVAWEKAVVLDKRLLARTAPRIAKAKREYLIEADMRIRDDGDFRCKFGESVPKKVVDDVVLELSKARERIGDWLGHRPGPVTVILYSGDDFARSTRTHGWVEGLYDGKIRISAAEWRSRRGKARSTLVHEYTHHVVDDLARRVPSWLGEGLAMMMEGEKPRSYLGGLLRANKAGRIIPLAGLERSFLEFKDANMARLAYAESLSFTAWLIERFTLGDMRNFVRSLDDQPDPSKALVAIYRKTRAELQAEWLKTIR